MYERFNETISKGGIAKILTKRNQLSVNELINTVTSAELAERLKFSKNPHDQDDHKSTDKPHNV